MIYSHANFHIHRATHDNDYVEWGEEEEEWLTMSSQTKWYTVNKMGVVTTFIKWEITLFAQDIG